LNELAFWGAPSLRGGGHGGGLGPFAHHYSETTLKARERMAQRNKVITALKVLTGAGTVGMWCFFVQPFVAWLM
jgi:hypothetical protein